MEFAVSAMNLVLKWHFQVSFSNLGHACEHFMLAIMGFWYVKLLCFYSKSLYNSSVLVSKNALCWFFTQNHSKQALCGGCTVMLGQAFCSWAETTAQGQSHISHATPAHGWQCQ